MINSKFGSKYRKFTHEASVIGYCESKTECYVILIQPNNALYQTFGAST